MRCLIFSILIMNAGILKAQASLEVVARNCRNGNHEIILYGFKVYRNDIFIENVIPLWIEDPSKAEELEIDEDDWSRVLINDIEDGQYTIEYTSVFETKESSEILVREDRAYSVDLCLDHLSYEKNDHDFIIDRLKDGEVYIIEYSHRGCFSSADVFLIIEKIAGQYYARMDAGADSHIKTKKLSEQEIELFRIFEIEINVVRTWGGQSTSSSDFKLSYNDVEIKVHSESSWDGWYYLLNEISWDEVVQIETLK